jgi:tRNA threonylcarbamoyladenosine biosynthesis protein TsaB
MKRFLAIDTTGDFCSLALKEGDRVYQVHESMPRQHARQVLPQLERLFSEAGWSKTSLDAVVYGRGPGSFTGIRIAAGVAQGIALGADCGVIPVSTLQTLALESCHLNPSATRVWVALDARMRELYFACYRVKRSFPVLVGEEALLTSDLLPEVPVEQSGSELYLAGNGWLTDYGFNDQWVSLLTSQSIEPTLPGAVWGATLAERLFEQDASVLVSPELALPVYLRDKVTWDKKPRVGE